MIQAKLNYTALHWTEETNKCWIAEPIFWFVSQYSIIFEVDLISSNACRLLCNLQYGFLSAHTAHFIDRSSLFRYFDIFRTILVAFEQLTEYGESIALIVARFFVRLYMISIGAEISVQICALCSSSSALTAGFLFKLIRSFFCSSPRVEYRSPGRFHTLWILVSIISVSSKLVMNTNRTKIEG